MLSVAASSKFYTRSAWFAFREELAGYGNAVGRLILYPFFVWLLTVMWQKFTHRSSVFTVSELFMYIGVTEIIQMNTLRYDSFQRASSDFSLSLARPRSWLVMQGTNIFGRAMGKMFLQNFFFIIVIAAMAGDFVGTFVASLRFFTLAPLVALLDALFCMMFASGKVLWDSVGYFRLPVSKLFLVFGGVLAPIADFAEPYRSLLLMTPFSDLTFQPAYFAVKGQFYAMSAAEWFLRIFVYTLFFGFLNVLLFRYAKQKHQSYGG